MRGSQLDRRITIGRKTVTLDPDYGTENIAWTVFASRIPAQVQGVMPSKSESTQQGLRMAAQPSRVRIRYMDGITSDMRVVVHDATAIMVYDWDAYFNRPASSGYADSVMEITAGPTEIFGRRKWLEFMVTEYSS